MFCVRVGIWTSKTQDFGILAAYVFINLYDQVGRIQLEESPSWLRQSRRNCVVKDDFGCFGEYTPET